MEDLDRNTPRQTHPVNIIFEISSIHLPGSDIEFIKVLTNLWVESESDP